VHSSARPSKRTPARVLTIGALTIRQATADDVPNIAEVHVRSWQAAYRGILADDLLDSLSVTESEGHWRALLSNTKHHWLNLVADDGNGGLAGFCAVTTPKRDAKEDNLLAEVGALYVDPNRWREGAGTAMLIAACEKLNERNWQEVVLWVLPENRRALAFYARYGFTIEEGVEKREERSGRSVIRLRASLPQASSS
jgi:ribosomal protein S18 acetylase RimI-like enzyme